MILNFRDVCSDFKSDSNVSNQLNELSKEKLINKDKHYVKECDNINSKSDHLRKVINNEYPDQKDLLNSIDSEIENNDNK